MKFYARYKNLPGIYTVFDSPNKTHGFKLAHHYRDDVFITSYDAVAFTLDDMKRKELTHKSFKEIQNTLVTYALQAGFTDVDFRVESITCHPDELEKELRIKSGERLGYLQTVDGFGKCFCKKKNNNLHIIYKIHPVEKNNPSSLQLMNESMLRGEMDKDIPEEVQTMEQVYNKTGFDEVESGPL